MAQLRLGAVPAGGGADDGAGPSTSGSEQPGAGSSAATALSPEHVAATQKFRQEFEKRLRDQGPRLFRWSDGSLRPDKPPPNPYAAASRKRWQALAQHCRTHGGDRSYEQTGRSLRYGVNVTATDHAAYLVQAGLQPEADPSSGAPLGYDPARTDALADPQHAFNSYYKAEAGAVLARARGRLL
eukprot:scaffold1.g5220.t1